jgi:DNA damage-binding protein 1
VGIDVLGNQIAVQDMIKSISVVELRPKGSDGAEEELVEIARHGGAVWGTAVVTIEKDMYLEADSTGNLTVLQRDIDGLTEENRRRLNVTCEFRLGEMVNKMQPSMSRSTPLYTLLFRVLSGF